jgi:hypothetical protein
MMDEARALLTGVRVDVRSLAVFATRDDKLGEIG